jgi:hypothetical protein
MDFSKLPGFDIEADLAPLTALHNASAQEQQQQKPVSDLSHLQFTPLPETPLPVTESDSFPSQNGDSDRKVFFITNCGSLLGRTIAQVALDRGHYVAACAREKHLADLNVPLFVIARFHGRVLLLIFQTIAL